MPPLGSDGQVESGDDGGDPATQRRRDSTTSTSTERSNHCADDTSRDDDVLERHHAVLVRAQTLQRFRGLDVIFQHRRNPFFEDESTAAVGREIWAPTEFIYNVWPEWRLAIFGGNSKSQAVLRPRRVARTNTGKPYTSDPGLPVTAH